MKKNPLISFILPNYNNQHVLDLFFEKFLKNNTYQNYEFIVTDDGSEDYSLAVLRKWQNSGQIKVYLRLRAILSSAVMAMQQLKLPVLLRSF